MIRSKISVLVIFAVILALSWPALAQAPGAGAGKGPRAMGPRLYDPQTVTTVKGQVESVGQYAVLGRRGMRRMRYQGLVLKTEAGSITVHLGPPWYVGQQGFQAEVGDTLEVTGSKITRNQQTILLASEVKWDDKSLKLRDDQGYPLWRGKGRRGGRRQMGW